VCTSAIGRAVRKIEGRDERLNFSTPAPSSPSQTFGDSLGFNPHCHVLVTDGGFYGRGIFRVAPPLDLKKLKAIFRHANSGDTILIYGLSFVGGPAFYAEWERQGEA